MANKDNPGKGAKFEITIQTLYKKKRIQLQRPFPLDIGVGRLKKSHKFDLGSKNPKILIECKAHSWTSGGNVPSAKMSVWNEAMYLFRIAPIDYKKILYVHRKKRSGETLAEYYVKRYEHLIPAGVEIWEYAPFQRKKRRVYPNPSKLK